MVNTKLSQSNQVPIHTDVAQLVRNDNGNAQISTTPVAFVAYGRTDCGSNVELDKLTNKLFGTATGNNKKVPNVSSSVKFTPGNW